MEPEGDPIVSLQWRNLKVKTKAGRQLLHGISGVALPGEVVALMGASGAGKTTLLNSLLQRNMLGLVVEGDVLVNGHQLGRSVTAVSAYVQQEDLFVGTLTVREHLMIQARMRLRCGKQEREERVAKVMKDMLLEGSQSSRIGVPSRVKGISGGEMKRLAFATEMLNNPPILFCDEPTTGLDSHMAMTVVQRLEALAADHGKTIICTIHQPSSEVFELFDKVVFLAQGRVAFHGVPHEAVLFFSKCGHMLPDHTNPADHYIDTLAIWPDKVDECKSRCAAICDEFEASELNKRLRSQMETCGEKKRLSAHRGNSSMQLLIALFIRYAKDNMRTSSLMRAKFLQKFVMGFFIMMVYFRTEHHQEGILSFMGILFYNVAEVTYSTCLAIQAYMPLDFPILVREYHDGIYPAHIYYVAKILSYLPLFSLDGILFICISYYGVGLKPDVATFLRAVVNCVITEWNVLAIGVAIASVSPTIAVAVSISGPLLTVLSLTGGLMVNVDELPDWIGWVQYLSWFRYGYENYIINQFEDNETFPCVGPDNKPTKFCLKTGQAVIDKLGFHVDNFYPNWIVMLIMTVGIMCIGYIGLVIRVLRAR